MSFLLRGNRKGNDAESANYASQSFTSSASNRIQTSSSGFRFGAGGQVQAQIHRPPCQKLQTTSMHRQQSQVKQSAISMAEGK